MQVALVPVDPRRHADAAELVRARLAEAGIRVRLLDRGTLGSRVARAHALPAPYVGVIGDRETAAGNLAVNGRTVDLDAFVAELRAEIDDRTACSPSSAPTPVR
ncbi:His/Gly/Thr/Pro-type tRNA ligase C-terminal domain-containing protein [Microbacterium sp. KUDC0406]|uniref:His/Gly/Thr/Pro-type tRNA ligase C-terminal domain-containing protein n=1 Tax=Microbacterium sp. KUDC0406 TaxID=2909588 RepID=UPI003FA53598